MNRIFKPTITLFHCANALSERISLPENNVELQNIILPCSSMIKDVFLLRAFETGADAVIVLACPEGECRYVDGNLRAKKRVERVKALLDDIGIDGRRLSLFNISPNDEAGTDRILKKAVLDLMNMGSNLTVSAVNTAPVLR